MSALPGTRLIKVERQQCHFNVYVQVDGGEEGQQSWKGKTVFLTVNDVGDDPQPFIEFVNHPSNAELRKHSVFLHVCVPGQEDGAPDLPGDFPSMDTMGEALVHVLDALDVYYCIGIGEGAGADILCRFAMAWPKRVLGLALIHCMATAHGIIDQFKEILTNLRLEEGNMNSAAWDYLFTHRYGDLEGEHRNRIIKAISERQNLHNLAKYLYAFSHRSDIGEMVGHRLEHARISVLLVTGAKTPHNDNVHHMYEQMPRTNTELLVMGDVNDVLMEAPERFGKALVLFCKGFGELSAVQIPGMEIQRSASPTMEEADRPSGRYSPRTTPTSA